MATTTNRNTLSEIMAILEQRKSASADSSYVAGLYAKGLNSILKKVGEEATETIIAAADRDARDHKGQVVYETADLWFHTMIMLAHFDLSADDVLVELERRFGTSGLQEKASRDHGK